MLIKPEKFKISSDYHLKHKNVLIYDNRPFATIEEHDAKIIENHNSVVKVDDDFFFGGDFCFDKSKARIEELIQQLNGNKYFIKGNHDHKDIVKIYEKYGTYLGEQTLIKVGESKSTAQSIVLNHFALRVWNKSHHGTWMLYGHSHGSLDHTPWGKSMDVGIMMNNYFPFDFYQIKEIMDKRIIHEVDHHITNGR